MTLTWRFQRSRPIQDDDKFPSIMAPVTEIRALLENLRNISECTSLSTKCVSYYYFGHFTVIFVDRHGNCVYSKIFLNAEPISNQQYLLNKTISMSYRYIPSSFYLWLQSDRNCCKSLIYQTQNLLKYAFVKIKMCFILA